MRRKDFPSPSFSHQPILLALSVELGHGMPPPLMLENSLLLTLEIRVVEKIRGEGKEQLTANHLCELSTWCSSSIPLWATRCCESSVVVPLLYFDAL